MATSAQLDAVKKLAAAGNSAAVNYLRSNQVASVDATRLSTPTAPLSSIPATGSAEPGLSALLEAQVAQQRTAAENNKKYETAITNATDTLANMGERRNTIAADEGLNTARIAVDDILNQMEAKNLKTTRQVEYLEKYNPEGLFGGGLTAETTRIQRDNNREQADLAIIMNARQRNYDGIREIVDAKVNAETEAQKLKLQQLQFFYDKNYDQLTTAQRNTLDIRIKEEERKYSSDKERSQKINDVIVESAKEGAPSALIAKISAAKTEKEALELAAPFIGKLARDNFALAQQREARIAMDEATASGSGGGSLSFTSTEKRDLEKAKLGWAPDRMKAVFLNTDTKFQEAFVRSGVGSKLLTEEHLLSVYETWEKTGKIAPPKVKSTKEIYDDTLRSVIGPLATDMIGGGSSSSDVLFDNL